jgi:HAD superfamily hydrolase (TIGR01509 family)
VGPELTSQELDEWVAEEKRVVTAHLAQTLVPDPQIQDALAALAQRFLLVVVSSSALSRLDACFQATGLDQVFPPERRFSAEDSLTVPTSKPDPAIYRHAGQQLGIAPGQAIAIEDAVPGAQAALAAGFSTIGNLCFVPETERSSRERLLQTTGVAGCICAWAETIDLLQVTT